MKTKNPRSKLTDFFIFCSGADSDWLNECPKKEVTKFTSIGSLIFMTGVFSFVSSSYAFHSLFNPVPLQGEWSLSVVKIVLSLLFGLLWGIFIFFLDRAFVSTMSKNSKILTQIILAIPRYALAFLISISISKPLEIFFFKGAIVLQISKNEQAENAKATLVETLKSEEADRSAEESEKRKLQMIADRDKPSESEIFYQKQYKECDDNCKKVENDNRSDKAYLDNKRIDLDNRYSNYKKDLDDPGKASEQAQIKVNMEAIEREKEFNEKKISLIQKSINTACACGQYKRKYMEEYDKRKKEYDAKYIVIEGIHRINEHKADSANSNLKKKEGKFLIPAKAAFSQNLQAQIEALNNLLDGKGVETDLSEMKSRQGMWLMHFVIWMLFFVVEIAPITMKLLLSRGEYDEIEKAHLESMKEQAIRYKEKIQKIYSQYYKQAETDNDSLLTEFFNKTRDERKEILSSLISDWKKQGSAYANLLKTVVSQLFEDIIIPDKKRLDLGSPIKGISNVSINTLVVGATISATICAVLTLMFKYFHLVPS